MSSIPVTVLMTYIYPLQSGDLASVSRIDADGLLDCTVKGLLVALDTVGTAHGNASYKTVRGDVGQACLS
jgi:hypothetical protein